MVLISDKHRLNTYLLDKRTNEWSVVFYELATPLITSTINEIVIFFLFDFINKTISLVEKKKLTSMVTCK